MGSDSSLGKPIIKGIVGQMMVQQTYYRVQDYMKIAIKAYFKRLLQSLCTRTTNNCS